MFKKVLIANRGEPAVRVVRACRDLGIPVVALYEPDDRGALYVHLADEAFLVEPPASYRDPDLVIALARQSGADAVHPGYGYLAEHLDFTRTCEQEGIVVIGPGSACLELTTNKIAALERVRQAGFSTVTASSRAFTPDEADVLHAEAERLGYPVIVKPWSGGRGRGTQVVREPARLLDVVREAAAAAQAVFGNPRVYLEAAVLPSRYVEVPLLADNYGALVHMGERDSTIQRNKRKVITESPAPGLTPAQRAAVRGAAVEIARLCGCRGACTVEFVVDADGQYYFTEVKPRLQVEHPATEMVTRIDAVREQIRLASGQPLGFGQDDVRIAGTGFLCRINAEDPWRDYLPSPGRIGMFRVPGGPNVRVDTYAFSGAEVSVRYESLFAKLTVWGANREEALHRLRRALTEFAITGINTNISMLRQMVSDPDFIAGTYDSEFSHRRLEPAARPDGESLRDLAAVAALAFLARVQAARPITPTAFTSGWHRDSRRLPPMSKLHVTIEGHEFVVEVGALPRHDEPVRVTIDGTPVMVSVSSLAGPEAIEWAVVGTHPYELSVDPDLRWIDTPRGRYQIQVRDLEATVARPRSGDGRVKAPIPGRIVRVLVEPGQPVQVGQPVVVLEAMKMENEIQAPRAGTVSDLHVSAGQVVKLHELLLEIS